MWRPLISAASPITTFASVEAFTFSIENGPNRLRSSPVLRDEHCRVAGNPQEVADAVLRVVETPGGQRSCAIATSGRPSDYEKRYKGVLLGRREKLS